MHDTTHMCADIIADWSAVWSTGAVIGAWFGDALQSLVVGYLFLLEKMLPQDRMGIDGIGAFILQCHFRDMEIFRTEFFLVNLAPFKY